MGRLSQEELLVHPRYGRLRHLFTTGRTLDVVMIALTLLLCVVASLWLVYPTHITISVDVSRGENEHLSRQAGSEARRVDQQCHVTFDSDRFDCWPEVAGCTKERCQGRGCCWDTGVGQGIPTCYYPRDFSNVYNVTSSQNTRTGLVATLVRSTRSPYPSDVMTLTLVVTYETNQRLRFKITGHAHRYEVPIELQKEPISAPAPEYQVTLVNFPFAITVRRKSTGDILFDSAGISPLIFADQYLQIGTRLASTYIYGLGEHRSSLKLDTRWTKFVFWTRDKGPSLNANLYGYHPFYMNLDGEGNAHGVFLFNSNAMEVDLQPHGSSAALTYRTIGGVLDFYVFTGPSPDSVIRQYVSLVGKPFFPPFWSLGFHLCKYGYQSARELKKIIARNRAARIPYDVQWNDIDYMSHTLDWTYNTTSYDGLPEIVEDLHNNSQRYIIIVDPAISNAQPEGSYPPYDDGLVDEIFVRASNGSYLVGKVWPGTTVFPDFFHPKAGDWWYKQAKRYHDEIPFDALWTDMNEPSNFVDGSLTGCTNSSFDNPPYIPAGIVGGSLQSRTICPSAIQAISWHYNLHSLYGFSEARASMAALLRLRSKRTIVISRSTFPSSGRYGGHWLGDNWSEWSHMYYSIPGILTFQMFGVPLVGADICGFGGDTTPELCTRWTQLGAFYPFMRNHDALGSKDQDPGAFDAVTQNNIRSVLQIRYMLLPYLYTLFFRSHVDGTAIARPLFFQYPGEALAVDRQFMWGTSLLISPVLEQGATFVVAYIPNDVWYDYHTGARVQTVGQDVLLDAPLSKINLHVRGGSIIARKPAAVTTAQLRRRSFLLLVALAGDGSASGEVFWDDGETLDTVEQNEYSHVTFSVQNGTMTNAVLAWNYRQGEEMNLRAVVVYGVGRKPAHVTVNYVTAEWNYISETKVLQIIDITEDLLKKLTIIWC